MKSRKGLYLLKRIALFLILATTGCQTTPYGSVQVSHNYPPGQCQELGQVIGHTNTRDQAREQALQDLRMQAARLNGNYVRLLAVTAYGTAARGIAYRCR